MKACIFLMVPYKFVAVFQHHFSHTLNISGPKADIPFLQTSDITACQSRSILGFLAKNRTLQNFASRRSLHHMAVSIMQISACYFTQRIGSLCRKVFQYSANMPNCALDFLFLWSIGTNFQLHMELRSI